jgi:hypothetical protein
MQHVMVVMTAVPSLGGSAELQAKCPAAAVMSWLATSDPVGCSLPLVGGKHLC